MPVVLIDTLKPKNNQPFPIVEDTDFLGGFRVVKANVDRDAIGPKLKKHGMFCYVSDSKMVWSWDAPSVSWVEAIDINELAPSSQPSGLFVAACPSTALPGTLVHPISGSGITVELADPHFISNLPAAGCVISNPSPLTAVVQTAGIVSGIFTGLTPGKTLFLGKNSKPSSTAPVPTSGELLFHQPIGIAVDFVTALLIPSITLTRVKG